MRFVGAFALGLAVLGMSYGAVAFVQWDLNAGNWSEGARAFCAMFGVPFAALTAAFVLAP